MRLGDTFPHIRGTNEASLEPWLAGVPAPRVAPWPHLYFLLGSQYQSPTINNIPRHHTIWMLNVSPTSRNNSRYLSIL